MLQKQLSWLRNGMHFQTWPKNLGACWKIYKNPTEVIWRPRTKNQRQSLPKDVINRKKINKIGYILEKLRLFKVTGQKLFFPTSIFISPNFEVLYLWCLVDFWPQIIFPGFPDESSFQAWFYIFEVCPGQFSMDFSPKGILDASKRLQGPPNAYLYW